MSYIGIWNSTNERRVNNDIIARVGYIIFDGQRRKWKRENKEGKKKKEKKNLEWTCAREENNTTGSSPLPPPPQTIIANSMLVTSWKPGKSLHTSEKPVYGASFPRDFSLDEKKNLFEIELSRQSLKKWRKTESRS